MEPQVDGLPEKSGAMNVSEYASLMIETMAQSLTEAGMVATTDPKVPHALKARIRVADLSYWSGQHCFAAWVSLRAEGVLVDSIVASGVR